jgi:tetraacyldisaccharide 4'-kinase
MTRIQGGTSDTLSLSEGSRMPVYGFCGIARPDSFHDMLIRSNMNLTGFQSFNDHHVYTVEDMKSLHNETLSSGAQAMITTEKDLVKVRDLVSSDMPLLTMPIRFKIGTDFDQYLLERFTTSLNKE